MVVIFYAVFFQLKPTKNTAAKVRKVAAAEATETGDAASPKPLYSSGLTVPINQQPIYEIVQLIHTRILTEHISMHFCAVKKTYI